MEYADAVMSPFNNPPFIEMKICVSAALVQCIEYVRAHTPETGMVMKRPAGVGVKLGAARPRDKGCHVGDDVGYKGPKKAGLGVGVNDAPTVPSPCTWMYVAAPVGPHVGAEVEGASVGAKVSELDGDADGEAEGEVDGEAEGEVDGEAEG